MRASEMSETRGVEAETGCSLTVGDLLHMDLCGPFPVQGPHGEKYFYNILDDKSNFSFTFGFRQKNDAFSHFQMTEAFL